MNNNIPKVQWNPWEPRVIGGMRASFLARARTRTDARLTYILGAALARGSWGGGHGNTASWPAEVRGTRNAYAFE